MSPGWRAAWQRLCWHHTGGGLRRLRSAWGRSARAISGGRLDAPRIRSGSRLRVGRGRGKGRAPGASLRRQTGRSRRCSRLSLGLLALLLRRGANWAAAEGGEGRSRAGAAAGQGSPGGPGQVSTPGPAASSDPDGAAVSPCPSLEGGAGEPFLGGRSHPAPWLRGSSRGGPRGQRVRAWVLLSGEAAGKARAWASSPSPRLLSLRGFLLLRGCPRMMRRLPCGSPERLSTLRSPRLLLRLSGPAETPSGAA